ncbi:MULTISPECIES: hypothetical protein [unclassified Burkholderia]|uniref:hypothetical protein n=1 Tax=unclassified Burkholderia TaxID=2613784 RepID=UPI000F568EA9|nr:MULTISPECIES: hypothetical protein [unclassified Burkholderia]RQR87703.1 hypothetical protein DIE10_06350 [Burkholderia sp. Bp9011]
MSDEIQKLEKERDYWKRVAAYLASCHAATLSHEGMMSRTSRSSRDRFESIVRLCDDFMVGYDGNAGSGYALSTPEQAKRCCVQALAYLEEVK